MVRYGPEASGCIVCWTVFGFLEGLWGADDRRGVEGREWNEHGSEEMEGSLEIGTE